MSHLDPFQMPLLKVETRKTYGITRTYSVQLTARVAASKLLSLRSAQSQRSCVVASNVRYMAGRGGMDCEEDGSPSGLSDDTEIEFRTSEEWIILMQRNEVVGISVYWELLRRNRDENQVCLYPW